MADMAWETSPRIFEDTQGAWKSHAIENCKIPFFIGAFNLEDKTRCAAKIMAWNIQLYFDLSFFSVSCFAKDDLKLCLLNPKNKQLMHMTGCQECRTLPFA